MRTMVLETFHLHFWVVLAIFGVKVGKYYSTMEHLGMFFWFYKEGYRIVDMFFLLAINSSLLYVLNV